MHCPFLDIESYKKVEEGSLFFDLLLPHAHFAFCSVLSFSLTVPYVTQGPSTIVTRSTNIK
jgi:hypothetical protein